MDILDAVEPCIDRLLYRGAHIPIIHHYVSSYRYYRLQLTATVEIEIALAVHTIYQVPMCYFRVIKSGRTVFNLDEIASLVSADSSLPPLVIDDSLGSPWLTVHPCDTQSYMEEHRRDPMVWFTTYGLPGVFTTIKVSL